LSGAAQGSAAGPQPPARARGRRHASLAAAAILLVVLSIAYTQKVSSDRRHRQHSAEAALRDDLAEMRSALADYHAKHQHNPASLSDLVRDGELRKIPIDPITGSNATWKTTLEESVRVDDFQVGAAKTPPTIVEIHSGANGADSTGRAFADY
jgi:general secretion pathway protein G